MAAPPVRNGTLLPGKSSQAGREEESDTLLSSWSKTKRLWSELASLENKMLCGWEKNSQWKNGKNAKRKGNNHFDIRIYGRMEWEQDKIDNVLDW